MKNKGKMHIFIIIPFLLMFVLIIGVTYALYSKTVTTNKNVSMKIGKKYIGVYGENKNNIGLNQTYTFTVENRGVEESGYELYLENTNHVDLSTITYNITKDGITTTGTLTSGSILKGNLYPKEVTTITLQVSSTITNLNYLGKIKVKYRDLLPNEPELVGDMIPVVYDGTNWVKASVTDGSWYNYDEQKWANAVTIKDQSKRATYKNASVGTAIAISDINTFLVWIPRYSYTLGNTYGYQIDGASTPSKATPGAFNIKFVRTSTIDTGSGKYTGDRVSGYYTPSSFCWGDTCDTSRSDSGNKELSGIWISKFEVTGTIDDIGSIPNVGNIISQGVAAFFTGIQSVMNGTSGSTNYGFSGNYDTHMMKNTEWGAVAYLSQSKYGKYGNASYTGADKEIYQNKSPEPNHITGSSNGTPSTSTTNTQVAYNVEKTGTGASTTGTIYGIYDMSGGAWEYVMGNYNDVIGGSGFTSMPSKKYYNVYTTSDATSSIKGDAYGADGTNGFYNDSYMYVNEERPWIGRGADYSRGEEVGIFKFNYSIGHASSNMSTRFVLVS